ncbi:MAG: hypothetical protein P8Y05_06725 [Deinococcales bacterium]
MSPLPRWILALAAALLLGHAWALQPVDGTEVILTYGEGHRLVGYGVVKDGFLMLRMGSSAESFVLVMLTPDGSVQSYQGIRGAGGALLVDLPDGSREPLSALLSKDSVGLRVVVRQDGGSHSEHASSSENQSGGSTASSGSSSGSSDSGVSVDTGDSSSSDSNSSDSSSSDSTDGP